MEKETIDKTYVDPDKGLWVSALKFLEREGFSEGLCAETMAGFLQRFVLEQRSEGWHPIAGPEDLPENGVTVLVTLDKPMDSVVKGYCVDGRWSNVFEGLFLTPVLAWRELPPPYVQPTSVEGE